MVTSIRLWTLNFSLMLSFTSVCAQESVTEQDRPNWFT